MSKISLEDVVLTIKTVAEQLDKDPREVNHIDLQDVGVSERQIKNHGGLTLIKDKFFPKVPKAPKILVLDIETSPLVTYTWGIFDQNIGLNQIIEDWQILSWGAKWLGSPENEVMYMDRFKDKDDKKLMKALWNLLDQADAVLAHNGASFDVKKVNARFLHHGMHEPSSYQVIDTLKIARKKFARTSNKLASLTTDLCKKWKKDSHSNFPGFDLWRECLAGNKKAQAEMARYNILDVLSLEELYVNHLRKWDKSINYSVYQEELVCDCGNKKFRLHDKLVVTKSGKFARYICTKCGKEHKSKNNLLTKNVRKKLLR